MYNACDTYHPYYVVECTYLSSILCCRVLLSSPSATILLSLTCGFPQRGDYEAFFFNFTRVMGFYCWITTKYLLLYVERCHSWKRLDDDVAW